MVTPAGGKKGGKKKKGQTVSLNEFLGDGSTTFTPLPKRSWADDEDDLGPADLAEEYGGPPEPAIDLSKLPSAPRASRDGDINLSRLPKDPPFTAFMGNLPFDVSEDDIRQLFRGLRVENVRFPQEQGKAKGYGYAEFFDLEQLKSALALNGEKIRSRQIRIDIADQAGKDGRGGGGFDDKTPGDWRRDEAGSGGGSRFGDRNAGFGDRGSGMGGQREDRRDGGLRRPAGPADTENDWRRDDPVPPQSSNGHDDKGGRGGDGRFGIDRDRPDGRGFKDYRDRGDFRDHRDRGDFRDHRDRGDFRDHQDRGDFRDHRDRGGFRDNRDRGGFRNDRERGGYRDDRDNHDRGRFGSDKNGIRDDSASSDMDQRDGPRERPKLNLQPRKTESKSESTSSNTSSSIFGAARPVDTAAKERQIEEKLMSAADKQTGQGRANSRERRDGSNDRGVGSPTRNSARNDLVSQDEGGVDNWRDESIRTDKTRVMKPGFSNRRVENSRSDNSSDNQKQAGRGRSPHERKQKNGPIIPPKYEEPAKPEFVQTSKFAALGIDDDDDEEDNDSDTDVAGNGV